MSVISVTPVHQIQTDSEGRGRGNAPNGHNEAEQGLDLRHVICLTLLILFRRF